MPKKRKKPGQKLQEWIEARKRHCLTHAQVQMARELGMKPKSLRKLSNRDGKPWKAPLKEYIEYLYRKQFGGERPENVMSIEEKHRMDAKKKARRSFERRQRRASEAVEAAAKENAESGQL